MRLPKAIRNKKSGRRAYVIERGKDGLCYVRFDSFGIGQIIRKVIGLDIAVAEFCSKRDFEGDEMLCSSSLQNQPEIFYHIANSAEEICDRLGVGDVGAMVTVLYDANGRMDHVIPHLIGKSEAGAVLVLFENLKGESFAEMTAREEALRQMGFAVKKVPNYSKDGLKIQKDLHSCAVFALEVLRDCLFDEEFCRSCLDEGAFTLPVSEKLGQSLEFEESFLPHFRARRLFDGRFVADATGRYNLMAWYLGHDYARRINPRHLEFLGEYERGLVSEIERGMRVGGGFAGLMTVDEVLGVVGVENQKNGLG